MTTSKQNYLCMDAHKHSIESLYSKPLNKDTPLYEGH